VPVPRANPVGRPTDPPGYLDLSRICGHLIRRSQQVHTVLWVDEFGTELTSPQYGVLSVLADRPRIDQRQLGELVSLDKSSAADVVARLESKLWLSRTKDPRDARRNLLELAPAAVIAIERLTPKAQSVQERLLAPVPAEDRALFVARLAEVARLDRSYLREEPGVPRVLSLDAPGHLIRMAQQVHTAIWAEEFDRELTGPQYAAMQVLSRSPGINQRRLGDLAALDKSTGADIVQRLVTRGWIRRARDPEDGRGRVLQLSAEAQQLTHDLAPRVAAVQERLLEPLTARARDEFLRRLALVAYAGEVPGPE
jgi:DNA-binding MarR family transcriptional regulator